MEICKKGQGIVTFLLWIIFEKSHVVNAVSTELIYQMSKRRSRYLSTSLWKYEVFERSRILNAIGTALITRTHKRKSGSLKPQQWFPKWELLFSFCKSRRKEAHSLKIDINSHKRAYPPLSLSLSHSHYLMLSCKYLMFFVLATKVYDHDMWWHSNHPPHPTPPHPTPTPPTRKEGGTHPQIFYANIPQVGIWFEERFFGNLKMRKINNKKIIVGEKNQGGKIIKKGRVDKKSMYRVYLSAGVRGFNAFMLTKATWPLLLLSYLPSSLSLPYYFTLFPQNTPPSPFLPFSVFGFSVWAQFGNFPWAYLVWALIINSYWISFTLFNFYDFRPKEW